MKRRSRDWGRGSRPATSPTTRSLSWDSKFDEKLLFIGTTRGTMSTSLLILIWWRFCKSKVSFGIFVLQSIDHFEDFEVHWSFLGFLNWMLYLVLASSALLLEPQIDCYWLEFTILRMRMEFFFFNSAQSSSACAWLLVIWFSPCKIVFLNYELSSFDMNRDGLVRKCWSFLDLEIFLSSYTSWNYWTELRFDFCWNLSWIQIPVLGHENWNTISSLGLFFNLVCYSVK